jgi:hypothetical protein
LFLRYHDFQKHDIQIYQANNKQIDWNKVASELDITNGHAARMRFSRYKQHAEGTIPTRKTKPAEAKERRKHKVAVRAKAKSVSKIDEMEDEDKDGDAGASIKPEEEDQVVQSQMDGVDFGAYAALDIKGEGEGTGSYGGVDASSYYNPQ